MNLRSIFLVVFLLLFVEVFSINTENFETFIAGGVSIKSRQYSKEVEAAKRRLAEEDPTICYVDLEGCELRGDDHLHFNGKGCQEAATRMIQALPK